MCQPGCKRVWRRMDTCICVAEPLCCSAEIITTLLIAYTPVQNKKVFKKRIHKASDSSPATLEARRQRSHALASCRKVTLSLVRLSIKWSTIQIFFKHARSQKFSSWFLVYFLVLDRVHHQTQGQEMFLKFLQIITLTGSTFFWSWHTQSEAQRN